MRRAAGIVLAAGLFLPVACGGDDDNGGSDRPAGPAPGSADPMAWADAYCTGLGESVAAAMELSTAGAQATTQAQKDSLLGYLDAAGTAFTDAQGRIEELGAPAVAQGSRHQDTVVTYFGGNLDALDRQRTQLDMLDPAAPDFAERFAAIEADGYDVAPLQPELDALRLDPEMKRPLETAGACQALGG